MFDAGRAETHPREVLPPTLDTVRAAAETLKGIANRTPVVTSRTLDETLGMRVFLKCESFQRSGSFKFRGAFNAIMRLSAAERASGVLTYSSGNHAQAVALVGKLLQTRVTVVMPENAPAAKKEATLGYGAEVVEYDPKERSREDLAREIAADRGNVIVPPFDHPDIVSGQGTAALELLDEAGPLDAIFAPCGGGGLLSGTALAASSNESCAVVGVEPEVADDAARSFRTGVLQRVSNPPTIADGLRTPSLGDVTWPIVRERVSEMKTVSELEIVEATRFLWTRLKLVIEPSGAVGLAGLLKDPPTGGARVGVILSGGNVDLVGMLAIFGKQ